MLYKINESNLQLEKIECVPYARQFQEWCERLTESQLETIRSKLQALINGDEVHTSSWMPGKDWTNTPWFPIYENACSCNQKDAAMCFGIFVWEAIMNHPADWSFGRYEVNDRKISGLTYFQIHP